MNCSLLCNLRMFLWYSSIISGYISITLAKEQHLLIFIINLATPDKFHSNFLVDWNFVFVNHFSMLSLAIECWVPCKFQWVSSNVGEFLVKLKVGLWLGALLIRFVAGIIALFTKWSSQKFVLGSQVGKKNRVDGQEIFFFWLHEHEKTLTTESRALVLSGFGVARIQCCWVLMLCLRLTIGEFNP